MNDGCAVTMATAPPLKEHRSQKHCVNPPSRILWPPPDVAHIPVTVVNNALSTDGNDKELQDGVSVSVTVEVTDVARVRQVF